MLVFSGIELASAGLRGVYAVAADAPVAEAKIMIFIPGGPEISKEHVSSTAWGKNSPYTAPKKMKKMGRRRVRRPWCAWPRRASWWAWGLAWRSYCALAGLTVAAVQKARDVAESRLGTGDFKGRGWQRASAGAGGIADAGVGSAEALSDEAGPREDATIVSILRSQEPIGRRRQ
ncbi:hypothetical protein T492DRAFT_847031 [Pavlovales sp. CCMP2436]|nr:hypothetical protein T492DRAFT_847031 [Pavlovales sp. CCMP2436]